VHEALKVTITSVEVLR